MNLVALMAMAAGGAALLLVAQRKGQTAQVSSAGKHAASNVHARQQATAKTQRRTMRASEGKRTRRH